MITETHPDSSFSRQDPATQGKTAIESPVKETVTKRSSEKNIATFDEPVDNEFAVLMNNYVKNFS